VTSIGARARRAPGWAVAVAAVVAVIALNLLLRIAGELTREPGGPRSSSYATAPHGLAAYAELLAGDGRRVVRLRDAPAEAGLDPGATVVVLDAGLPPVDARMVRRFVRRGGRLVTGGELATTWLRPLLGAVPRLLEGGPTAAAPIASLPELAGVGVVRTLGRASWGAEGTPLPALAGERGVVLAVADAGRGRVALLADTSPLQNRLLDTADNAALGLALAGPRTRPVVFLESVHGYGDETGLAAVPFRWWWALGGLALAALVFVLARGRRLGPPELPSRPLPPPRREYVESLAAVLARTKRPSEALAAVSRDVRRVVAARAGVDPDSDPARAAAALGVEEAELRAALSPAGDADVLPAGRVLSRAMRMGTGP
jgi:hypothetical protein